MLEKDVVFKFDEACLKAFEELKAKLTYTTIVATPTWSLSFSLICNASDHTIDEVFGQRSKNNFHTIYYASKTLIENQLNYTTTEKE